MKILDIAIKDVVHGLRSSVFLAFTFVIPLLITSLFYFMFGRISEENDFSLPTTKIIVANLDKGGPKFQVSTNSIPGGKRADTMGELIVNILSDEEMADLIQVTLAPDATTAKSAVDNQQAQVALIIPEDFSQQYADTYGEATIEFYQDPTLTIGPMIVRSIMDQFMDGMSGVKIAITVALDQEQVVTYTLIGNLIQQYITSSLAQSEDVEDELLTIIPPKSDVTDTAQEEKNMLLSIITPIMGGFMTFFAFYTGTASSENILQEEEKHTLQRLFTTPTPQSAILSGKFLAVFLTVFLQIVLLMVAAHIIFGIQWGNFPSVAFVALGIILTASSCGIFINSFVASTRQGGVVFGGILTITGMLGMIRTFGMSSTTETLGNTVALLVPQGWAVRGLLQAMDGLPIQNVLITFLVMVVWSIVFFSVGVWRFNHRYA
ncbi:MAG: ABC transporter permease [Anaerolineales bacterium]|nr:ABC transporter permease [Anaerolineales bacterium]